MLEDTPGRIRWVDLTVPNAPELRDFYAAVVGWRPEPVPMGTHEDWSMFPPDDAEPVAGVCHALGTNVGLPPAWLIYITVADLAESIDACKKLGGKVIWGPRKFGTEGQWCVIRDPAGAYAALFESNQAA